MSGLTLNAILADLTKDTKSAEPTKVEPVKESTKTASAKNELLDALKRAETEIATQKTASVKPEGSPVADLTKLATELAQADYEALAKEAEFYGAAIADGFMSRIGQYENATQGMPKVASVGGNSNVAFDVQKIAEQAVNGYVEARAKLEKEASDAYAQGYQDTLKEVEKIAQEIFVNGTKDCEALLPKS